jgi:hypothetical protein
MPWKIDEKGEARCTNCKDGYVPCQIDHKAQPPNDRDEFGEFFFCPECDWTTSGENNPDGTVNCPECGCYERKDTFEGDFTEQECEYCEKKGATRLDVPVELCNNPDWIKYGAVYLHDPCLTTLTAEMRADLDARTCDTCGRPGVRCHLIPENQRFNTADQKNPYRYSCDPCHTAYMDAVQAKIDERNSRNDFLHGGGLISRCDNCGAGSTTYKHVEFIPPDTYLCAACGGNPHPLEQRVPITPAVTVAVAEDDQDDLGDPVRGWYHDPEHPGYCRWWSGDRWSGGPTLEEHCLPDQSLTE